MSFNEFAERDSFVHRLDPRARLAVCGLFIVAAALSSHATVLSLLLALAIAALSSARVSLREIGWRLLALNLFIAMLAACLPGPGGGLAIVEGFKEGAGSDIARMAFKCNAILIAATALAGTMDMANFGHALAHLGVPSKLAQLLLFTVRQIETLRLEYLRLKDAMKARAFRPRTDLHTYRTLAALAAMLLLRSLDRAERVSDAMKCRRFSGHFYLMNHFKMRRADWIFASLSCTFLVLATIAEFAWKSH